jgi:hypothetical protein
MKHSLYQWGAPLLVALGLLAPAFPAQAQATVSFIVETAPPARLEESPSYVYEGHPVYYVNDRYYYRHGNDWVYYREPPQHLRQHRWNDSRQRTVVREREREREPRAAERHERRAERREVRHDEHRDRGHRDSYVAPRAR